MAYKKLRVLLGGETVFETKIPSQTTNQPQGKLGNELTPTDERQSLGLAGQFLVSWKLMQLGFTVKAFGANAPADLWVPELRILVEAKVAQKGYTKNKHKGKEFLTGCYPFNMTNLSSHFVVVWTLDINKFYIIPTTQLKIGVNRIYPMGKKWGYYQDNWSILKATILPDTDK